MANTTDTNVHIEAIGCLKEVREYLKEVDRDAYYIFIGDAEVIAEEGSNTGQIIGQGVGRWTFETNAKGTFGKREQRHTWCKGRKLESLYNKLIQTLNKDHEASVLIDYKGAEPGMGFFEYGDINIKWNNELGKVETTFSYESTDLTPQLLVDEDFVDTLEEAKEYLGYGYDH